MILRGFLIILIFASSLCGLGIEVQKITVSKVPIIIAIKAGKYKKFKKLFNKHKLHKRYSQKRTLLHYASLYNKKKVAKVLVQKGTLLGAKGGEYDATPLHTAIRYGYLDLAVYLIKNNAPLDIIDKYGEKPYDIAKRLDYTNIIQLLNEYKIINKGESRNEQNEVSRNYNSTVNKYKKGGINKYKPQIKANKVLLRDVKINSEYDEKNNKSIGERNSNVDIGN